MAQEAHNIQFHQLGKLQAEYPIQQEWGMTTKATTPPEPATKSPCSSMMQLNVAVETSAWSGAATTRIPSLHCRDKRRIGQWMGGKQVSTEEIGPDNKLCPTQENHSNRRVLLQNFLAEEVLCYGRDQEGGYSQAVNGCKEIPNRHVGCSSAGGGA